MSTKYQLAVGEYEDALDLGTFASRSAAYLALGEHVMLRAQDRAHAGRPVEYPAITEVKVADEPAEPVEVPDEDRRVFDAVMEFGRRDGEPTADLIDRTAALVATIDDGEVDPWREAMIADARERHGVAYLGAAGR